MEILVTIVIVFMVTFAIFGVVNMFKQINKVDMDRPNHIGCHIKGRRNVWKLRPK